MQVDHEGHQVIIRKDEGESVSVAMDSPVADAVVATSAVIVLLDPRECKTDQNVLGLSFSGDVLWRIAEPTRFTTRSPYLSVRADGAHALLYNWSGVLVTIDALTGEILEKELIR